MNINSVFLHLIDMSITASFVILAVIAVRFVLSLLRAPKVFSYALWIVVFFRLVCPFSIESNFSIVPEIPALDEMRAAYLSGAGNLSGSDTVGGAPFLNDDGEIYGIQPAQNIGTDNAGGTGSADINGLGAAGANAAGNLQGAGANAASKNDTSTGAGDSTADNTIGNAGVLFSALHLSDFIKILAGIWITVFAALLTYALASSLSLVRKLGRSYEIPYDGFDVKNEIRTANFIQSPFVFGLANPKIYLPEGISQTETDYIVLHEQTHIKRGDHIIKIAAFLVLCMHWFNPLTWLAFSLMNSDMEKSCDEKVIKTMGAEIKKQYSSSLLALSSGGMQKNTHSAGIRRFSAISGTPLTFSENNVKGRIKNVLGYKKPKARTLIASALIVTLSVSLLACNPLSGGSKEDRYGNDSMIGKTYESIEKCAEEFVDADVAYHNSLGEYTITDATISNITPLISVTLDKSEENSIAGTVSAYLLEYKLKPSDISKVTFAGGMDEEDGWIVGTGSMGRPVLIIAENGAPDDAEGGSDNSNGSGEGGTGSKGSGEVTYLGNAWSGDFRSDTKSAAETSMRSFLESQNLIKAETYSGNHKIAEFTASTGETWKLLLSQPEMQGGGGIWCVERWMDGQGTVYLDYPEGAGDMTLSKYYAEVQKAYNTVSPVDYDESEADAAVMVYSSIDGLNPSGSSTNALGTALSYIRKQLNHSYMEQASVKLIDNASLEDFYEPPTNSFVGYISAFTDSEDYFHLDRVELITVSKFERLASQSEMQRTHLITGETRSDYILHAGNTYIYNSYPEVDYMETNDETKYYLLAESEAGSGDGKTQKGSDQRAVTREELGAYINSFAEDADEKPLFDIKTKQGFVTEIRERAL